MSTPAPAATRESVGIVVTAAAWGALGACLIAVFMQMLDMTIVNAALPSIARDLSAPGSAQVFVVSGYSLAFAGALMTAARIGERLGRRRVFLGAMAAFTVASACCGVAQLSGELIVARGVQGLAAAGMSAQVIAIITAAFPKAKQPFAFGLYGAAAGLAAMAGPMLGGVVIAWDPLGLGWRAIFLLNIPLCVFGSVLAHRSLCAGGPAKRDPLDIRGVVTATGGLLALLYPLTAGREQGWSSALLMLFVAGAGLLAGFVRQQRLRLRAGASPLLRVDLFSDRGFAVGSTLTLVFFGVFAAFLLTVSVTAQSGLGLSALRTGMLMLPFALGAALGALTSPLLVARLGSRALTLGVLVFALAVGALALTIDPAAAAIDMGGLVAPILCAGAGMGWFAAPLPAVMMAGVADLATGSASGTVPTVQQVGSSIGAAVLGALFFHRVAGESGVAVAHAKTFLAESLTAAHWPAGQRDRMVGRFADCADAALRSATPHLDADTCAGEAADLAVAGRIAAAHAYLGAYVTVLWVVAGISLALAVLSLALPRSARESK